MRYIKLTNQNLLTNLSASETFTAGDFPVKVLQVSGSNGVYSGNGYIVVPYLGDAKIAVVFNNITINTDYQLIKGSVKTTYDPQWKNVMDPQEIVDGIKSGIKDLENIINKIEEIIKGGLDTPKKKEEAANEIDKIKDVLNNNLKDPNFNDDIHKELGDLQKDLNDLAKDCHGETEKPENNGGGQDYKQFSIKKIIILLDCSKENLEKAEEKAKEIKNKLNELEDDWGSKTGAKIHQRANSEVVNNNIQLIKKIGKEPKDVIEALDNATVFADSKDFQTGDTSFRHAMNKRGDDVSKTKIRADEFVRRQFNSAIELKKKGVIDKALYEWGIGIHALQDATSPSHSGFKNWSDDESAISILNHVAKELTYPGNDSNLYKITLDALKWFNKEQIPFKDNIFNHIKSD